ncbi:putative dimethylaniline monooxygenase [Thozetella sp. PMI_491]|nr:putative dimethylaniline monooxygenase [Thozetella sp. PMI_491]
MGGSTRTIKSVAIIGAGASGAAAAAAFGGEEYFDVIKIFERRQEPGGTWLYDPVPTRFALHPGALPPQIDKPLNIPSKLPTTTAPSCQERYDKTPVYAELTTNVPAIAMSLSDRPFAYGPFVPHWIPRQYLADYFSIHGQDRNLVLNTTVEDVTHIPKVEGWRLTLRKHDPARKVDEWWQEEFDAVVIAHGHYSVPYIPEVPGLPEYISAFPGRVMHSKVYRTAHEFAGQRLLVIGNSASGHDVADQVIKSGLAAGSVYQSRRSKNRWDGDLPPEGIVWKPIIERYTADGTIVFVDGTTLGKDDIDAIVYCTGYKISFPWWNVKANGRPLWDYDADRVLGNYQHTFLQDFPTLGIVGVPRALTFRSFEYQAIALARVFAGRATLPSVEEQKAWEAERAEQQRNAHKRFHDIDWDNGSTVGYLTWLYRLAGLPQLDGKGRAPPVLDAATRWAIENIKKYPVGPRKPDDSDKYSAEVLVEHDSGAERQKDGWVVVDRTRVRERPDDSLWFI